MKKELVILTLSVVEWGRTPAFCLKRHGRYHQGKLKGKRSIP
jgi:hypothetical protein